MTTAWLYKYILVEDLPQYESEGWELVGPMLPGLAGWDSVIVRREDEPLRRH